MPQGRLSRKNTNSERAKELKLSALLREENMHNNFNVCICEATGLTIAKPSNWNVAHIVSKGSLCAARHDRDNLVIVCRFVHRIMDDIGVTEDTAFTDLLPFIPLEYAAIESAMEKLEQFFNELPYRVELIKSRYKEVVK